jgi:hypothetical protein
VTTIHIVLPATHLVSKCLSQTMDMILIYQLPLLASVTVSQPANDCISDACIV